jgi:hypothetical protein
MSHKNQLPQDNDIRVSVDDGDIIVDFYTERLSVEGNEPPNDNVQRVVLPLKVARQFSNLLHEAIETPEDTSNDKSESLQDLFDQWDREGRTLDLDDDWLDEL